MVRYDFEALTGNVALINQFVEVVDSHGDWIDTLRRIEALTREPLASLSGA